MATDYDTAKPPASRRHDRNLSAVLRHALLLAELAGKEQDASRRADLLADCMMTWRAAQRLRRGWPARAC